MKTITLFLSCLILTIAAHGSELTKGGEYFVLGKQKQADGTWKVLAIDSNDKGHAFKYDPNSKNLSLFDNSKVGLIAFPTNHVDHAVYIKAKNSIPTTNADATIRRLKADPEKWKMLTQRRITDVNGKLTVTNGTQPVKATDTEVACPTQPQIKNGNLCAEPPAAKALPPTLVRVINDAAKKYNVPAALIASIIHQETEVNPFAENKDSKRQCEEATPEKPCPDYKWEKGMAQLGANNARDYGLDWNTTIPRTSHCDQILTETCFSYLENECAKVKAENAKPVNCPGASIHAVAKHLSDASLPEDMTVNVTSGNKSGTVDFKAQLFSGKNDANEIRNRTGYYNRGPRVFDSYHEFLSQNGRFAKNYGEAWATPRVDSTPSKEMGYRVLQGEYVNRCYVWRVAGLCGDVPANSLYGQYSQMLGEEPSTEYSTEEGSSENLQ